MLASSGRGRITAKWDFQTTEFWAAKLFFACLLLLLWPWLEISLKCLTAFLSTSNIGLMETFLGDSEPLLSIPPTVLKLKLSYEEPVTEVRTHLSLCLMTSISCDAKILQRGNKNLKTPQSDELGLESHPQLLLSVWPWARNFISLSPGLVICKTGTTVPSS